MCEKRAWSYYGLYFRQGYPPMYGNHLNMLARLVESEAAGYPWLELPLRKKAREKLLNADIITISIDPYTGKRAYKITLRGKRLLEAFQHKHRNDGLCPRCKREPRTEYKSGRVDTYCAKCSREIRRQKVTDQPCARCGEKPRAFTSNGLQSDYCEACGVIMRRRWRNKEMSRRRERIEAGQTVLCSRCGEKPVHVSGKVVYRYCTECKSILNIQFQRRARRNRKLRIIQAITRKRGSDAAD